MNIEDVLKGHGIGGGGSNIKSIQRGTVTMNAVTKDITISAVDLSKSIVQLTVKSAGSAGADCITGELTSATNLKLASGTTGSGNSVVEWTVIEFNNVKSLQSGTTTQTTTTPVTVTISSVDLTKSILFFTFNTTTFGPTSNAMPMSGKFTNNTTLSFANYDTTGTKTIKWQVIEFN